MVSSETLHSVVMTLPGHSQREVCRLDGVGRVCDVELAIACRDTDRYGQVLATRRCSGGGECCKSSCYNCFDHSCERWEGHGISRIEVGFCLHGRSCDY